MLVLGVVASTWQAIRATRSQREQSRLREKAQQAEANEARLRQKAEADQKKAETEAAKSWQVSALLQAMLRGVDPDEAAGQDTTLLRNILDRTAAQVRVVLKDQPEVEAELLHTVYDRIGEIPKAEATFREAVAIERNLMGSGHSEFAGSLSDWLDDLGHVLSRQGKLT